MAAVGRGQGWWRIITLEWPQPSPGDDDLKDWRNKYDLAAGVIYLMLETDQHHHVAGMEDNPMQMWTLLKAGNQSKKPGMRC